MLNKKYEKGFKQIVIAPALVGSSNSPIMSIRNDPLRLYNYNIAIATFYQQLLA